MKRLFLIYLVLTSFTFGQSLAGKKICLDPGHGFPPGGAAACSDAETKRFESYVNHIVVPYLKRFLTAAGATVITTRADYDSIGTCITLTQRKTIANNNNVNFFHSVHHNAFNGTSNYSLSLFKQLNTNSCPNGNPAWPGQADALAEIQASRLYGALNTTTGYARGDMCFLTFNLGVLSTLNMPGTLSEGSFFDYPAEKVRLANIDYLETEAEALLHSFMQYYGQPLPSHGSLVGIVTNSTTGLPANNVKITIESLGKEYQLDERGSGFYRFDSLTPGSYTLKLTTSRDTSNIIVAVLGSKINRANLTFRVTESVGDVKIKSVQSTANAIYFQWEKPTGTVDFYDIYLSENGTTFDTIPARSIAGNLLSSSISGLSANKAYYLKMKARNNIGESYNYSKVYGAYTSGAAKKILIVDGFSRNSGGGSYTQPVHNFASYYGESLKPLNVKFETVGNFVVTQSSQLIPYTAVFWFVGDETTTTETFSTAEQTIIKEYLKQGGKMFITGSEIGFDLYQNGDFNDKEFYNKYLKASYAADEPNPNFPMATPVQGGIFDGIPPFNFGVSYPDDHPDVIDTLNGSSAVLEYNSTQKAGITYQGLFPSGVISGKLVYLPFAFETIEEAVTRNLIVSKIVEFFGVPTAVEEKTGGETTKLKLNVNPNPVYGSGKIRVEVVSEGDYSVSLFDNLGRMVQEIYRGELNQGVYEFVFNISDQASGVYFIRFTDGKNSTAAKFLYLK